jgi:methylornithine synthase
MRLVFPGKLIPATLDVEGLAGLKQRLEAGANVVTSIVPPHQGLVGVAQSLLDIDDARRNTASVLSVLEDCGLRPQPVTLATKDTKSVGSWQKRKRGS